MKEEKEDNNRLSFFSFISDLIGVTKTDNKDIFPWGEGNNEPFKYLKYYNEVPDHSRSIDFTGDCVVGNGVNIDGSILDYWTLVKIISDYILFGGYAINVKKLVNGNKKYEYIDIANLRYSSKNENKIFYSKSWNGVKTEATEYDLVNEKNEIGIFIFTNIKTRGKYPRPYYLSSLTSVDTLKSIGEYHNNNANNGFAPTVIINVPGNPTQPVRKKYEESIKTKMTGSKGQKFILSFNENPDSKTTFDKLENDNLDQKFETLQKYLRNAITIGHAIQPVLIGAVAENQGFSKTEYNEALDIFKEITVKGLRNELTYSLEKLTGIKDVKFIDENVAVEVSNNTNNVTTTDVTTSNNVTTDTTTLKNNTAQ